MLTGQKYKCKSFKGKKSIAEMNKLKKTDWKASHPESAYAYPRSSVVAFQMGIFFPSKN
jgi:hypothetical protein